MTTLQKTLVVAIPMLGTSIGVYEAYRAFNLQKEISVLQQKQASLTEASTQTRSLTALRRENEQLRSENAILQKDSQELMQWQTAETEAAKDPSQKAMLSWLERVDRLKQLMTQTVTAQIPELKLLSDQDWLDVTADNFLTAEKDYRYALAELRSAAEKKFIEQVQLALDGYERDHKGQFPPSLALLKSYLDVSVDDAMLQRWMVAPAAEFPDMKLSSGGDFLVAKKDPLIDKKYDFQRVFNAHSLYSNNSQFSTSVAEETTAELLSFDQGMKLMQKLEPIVKAYVAVNNGQEPTNISQLLPYATNAEQKSMLQEMIRMQPSHQ